MLSLRNLNQLALDDMALHFSDLHFSVSVLTVYVKKNVKIRFVVVVVVKCV